MGVLGDDVWRPAGCCVARDAMGQWVLVHVSTGQVLLNLVIGVITQSIDTARKNSAKKVMPVPLLRPT